MTQEVYRLYRLGEVQELHQNLIETFIPIEDFDNYENAFEHIDHLGEHGAEYVIHKVIIYTIDD